MRSADPRTRLASGAEGTVLFTDDAGTVHVQWDTGSTLGLVPGVDRWDELCSRCGRPLRPGCCPTLVAEDER